MKSELCWGGTVKLGQIWRGVDCFIEGNIPRKVTWGPDPGTRLTLVGRAWKKHKKKKKKKKQKQ